jgi:hypothetical protein
VNIVAKAQIVNVNVDTFFTFEHSLSISTDEAVSTKNYKFISYGIGITNFVFDETKKMVDITFYNGEKDFAFIDSVSKYDNGEINYFVTFSSNLKGYYSLSTLRERNVLWCGYYLSNNTMGNWSSVVKEFKN